MVTFCISELAPSKLLFFHIALAAVFGVPQSHGGENLEGRGSTFGDFPGSKATPKMLTFPAACNDTP